MAHKSALPASIAGFTVLPVSYSARSTHILYARVHSPPKKTKQDAKGKHIDYPAGRTLFLVNVPPDATDREITLLFKDSGTVENVVFDGQADTGEDELGEETESEDEGEEDVDARSEDEDGQHERPRKKRKTGKDAVPQVVPLPSLSLRTLRQTGRSAHVVFLDESSLSRALSPPSKPKSWPKDSSIPSGLAHYQALNNFQRPPLDVVKAHADTWMELFEYEQAKRKRQSKYRMGEAIVDEDGFTLVTRGGAYGKTLGGGVGVASKTFQSEQQETGGKRNRKNKKEKVEKDSFYAFQIHEKKRKELIDMKRKWEEDKAKVEKLKQSRKFRPY